MNHIVAFKFRILHFFQIKILISFFNYIFDSIFKQTPDNISTANWEVFTAAEPCSASTKENIECA